MFAVTFSAETTFELRLSPEAFKLLPVMFPVTETVVPVKLAALTSVPAKMLPPVILPCAEINPGVVKLPPAMLAVTFRFETTLLERLNPPAFKLAPIILPAALTILPVSMLPPVTLPVADTNPIVVKLFATTLPLTEKSWPEELNVASPSNRVLPDR